MERSVEIGNEFCFILSGYSDPVVRCTKTEKWEDDCLKKTGSSLW